MPLGITGRRTSRNRRCRGLSSTPIPWVVGFLAVFCGNPEAKESRVRAATPPLAPSGPRVTLRWNDAADTTQLLQASPHRPLRMTAVLTGCADSLFAYRLDFRIQPTGAGNGTAWKFADQGACKSAHWTITAERDSMAKAPWRKKLVVDDLRIQDDGTVWMGVVAAFDTVALHADSSYALCHVDLYPPEASSDSAACGGWDQPARIYVESGEVYVREAKQPIFELGKAIRFEPLAVAGTGNEDSTTRDTAKRIR